MNSYFRAVGADFDGTLTQGLRPVDAVLDAVADLRATGVRSILVTGRILGELRHGLQTRPPPRTKENTSNG